MNMHTNIQSQINFHLEAIKALVCVEDALHRRGRIPAAKAASTPKPDRPARCPKYAIDVLGRLVSGETLPDLIGCLVAFFDELAPDALLALSKAKAVKRNFVSKQASDIHPHRPDLKVSESAGWYYSANIGREDTNRFLRALCDAAGLKFGTDITGV